MKYLLLIALLTTSLPLLADTPNQTQLLCDSVLRDSSGKIVSKTKCTDKSIIVRDAKGQLLFKIQKSNGRITDKSGRFIGRVST